MTVLSSATAFIIAISILVIIHELGHYAVARAFNVKVLRFSLGFGPALWARRFGPDQTEWAICAIPLGGYVSMLNEQPEDATPIAESDWPRTYSRQPVLRRIFIVLAGPLANLLLALLLYAGLAVAGITEPRALLDAAQPGSPAARAGITQGDEIVAINDTPVRGWSEVRWQLLQAALDQEIVPLRLQGAAAEPREVRLDLSGLNPAEAEADALRAAGISLLPGAPVVSRVDPESPAARVGLEPGDRILTVNVRPTVSVSEVIQAVKGLPGQLVVLELDRGGQLIQVSVTPVAVSDPASGRLEGRLGVALTAAYPTTEVRYGLFAALQYAFGQTADMAWFSLRMLGKMLIGEVSFNQLSGPLTIADYAGQTARLGAEPFISFLALISISIGVLNLLPIPVLDGGHLMYYVVELIRKKPLTQRTQERLQRFGLAILMALMSVALFNDVSRLLT